MLWKADARVIDGAVNGTGQIVVETGALVRQIQTGSVRAYAVSVLLGAVVIVGYYLWSMIAVPLLTLLVLVPLAGVAVIAMIGGEREALIHRVALVVSLVVFALTLLCGRGSTPRRPTFSSSSATPGFRRSASSTSSASTASACFCVVLTGFLTPLALLSSWESIHTRVKAFAMFVLALEAAMIGVFIALDLFLFYVFWDAMLDPDVFPHRHLGLRQPRVRRHQVHALHDGRQRADAGRDSGARLLPRRRHRLCRASIC